jgi:hypothetical protein
MGENTSSSIYLACIKTKMKEEGHPCAILVIRWYQSRMCQQAKSASSSTVRNHKYTIGFTYVKEHH